MTIEQHLKIRAPRDRVFAALSTPAGLNTWWTETCDGVPELNATYALSFGPLYRWEAAVVEYAPPDAFALTITRASDDWVGSQVSFRLRGDGDVTWLQFRHSDWEGPSEHFFVSAHCWALYLRLLRRSLEHGEVVPYAERLDA